MEQDTRQQRVLVAPGVRGRRAALPWYADVGVRLVKTKPLGVVGLGILLVIVVAAVFADLIAPYGYNEPHIPDHRFAGYSWQHWLGADQLGRDMLTRVMYGARISLFVGLVAIALSSVVGTAIGLVSAYAGGRVDMVVQRFVDAYQAFPGLLLLLTIMSLLGPGLLNLTVVLGLTTGIVSSRVIRGTALSVKENTYIEAARALGAGAPRIVLGHMLPNVAPTIIVLATIGLGNIILIEASLSFLGFGVPPPHPTWGGMLSIQGLQYMQQAPHMAIWPGVALSLAVFGFNMFGDALRDVLDPRLRGSR